MEKQMKARVKSYEELVEIGFHGSQEIWDRQGEEVNLFVSHCSDKDYYYLDELHVTRVNENCLIFLDDPQEPLPPASSGTPTPKVKPLEKNTEELWKVINYLTFENRERVENDSDQYKRNIQYINTCIEAIIGFQTIVSADDNSLKSLNPFKNVK